MAVRTEAQPRTQNVLRRGAAHRSDARFRRTARESGAMHLPSGSTVAAREEGGLNSGLLWPRSLEWADLSDRDREVYEVGFLMGFLMREDEVVQANADADRFYRLAFAPGRCGR